MLTYNSLGSTADGRAGRYYFIQNDVRTLDQYGEWHYAAGTGKLSVYFGAVNPATKTTKVTTLANLLLNSSYSDYITIDGLSLTGSNSSTIMFGYGTDHCTFKNCEVSFSGDDGFTVNGAYVIIDNTSISSCNGGGIFCDGINATITNNSIKNIGVFEGQSNMISSCMGLTVAESMPLIQYNSFENIGYMGIYLTAGNTGLIKNNFVNYPCLLIDDSGGIYLGHDHPNTIVDGNIVLNTRGNGIYLDEYCTGVTVMNNSVSNCLVGGIKLHKANNNSVKNNTSYNCTKGIVLANWVDENNLIGDSIIGNILVAKEKTQYPFSYITKYTSYISTFPSLKFNNNYYARPIDDTNSINTYLLAAGNKYITLSQWQTLSGLDANTKKSPQTIANVNDLQFEYNATKTAKTITLSQPMIDVKGTKYATSVTLQPYSSVVLMKDAKPTKYSTEYKSICDGLSYNGWTITGKYERTLVAKSGADSIITTYLTVNPKFAVQENITILSGESYQGWSTAGTYSRTLSSVTGCDSVVTTNLTVDNSAVKVIVTQTIALKKGANMVSTYLQATDPDISTVTKTLRDSGNLIKMQNESGSSYENWGILGGWINNLGSLQNTEGYKLMVANDCSIQITGTKIALPLNIPLNLGWNIISFPRTDILDAKMIIQSLIDQNVLVKVQDELGNSIEDWGIAFGGWKNGIGNFQSGKAYRVKVSANAVLTIKDVYPKSVTIPVYNEQTEHFQSIAIGNGSDHMNINLVGLKQSGLTAGDELAAYDGQYCVGTLKITEQNLLDGTASLVASCSNNNLQKDGFDEGSTIHVRIWNHVSGNESGIQVSILQGSKTYIKSATMLGKMPNLTTSITSFEDEVRIDVYPNPCQGRFTVHFSDIPETGSRIDIVDLSGRKVASQLINGISEEFDLFGQAAGIYLVRTTIGSVEKINKLVIQ